MTPYYHIPAGHARNVWAWPPVRAGSCALGTHHRHAIDVLRVAGPCSISWPCHDHCRRATGSQRLAFCQGIHMQVSSNAVVTASRAEIKAARPSDVDCWRMITEKLQNST
jgi:hypothetical protein